MLDPQIIAFTGVAALLTVTPGADTLLVMRSVLARGARAGVLTAVGIAAGCLLHAALSALGLSLILLRSAALYDAVKWLGAAYLIYLGAHSLWLAWRKPKPAADSVEGNANVGLSPRLEPRRAFAEGLVTNLFNPKVAIFYLAFLPQFIQPGEAVFAKSMLLAFIHALLGVGWLALISVSLSRMRAVLERPAIKRAIETTTGAILILFGLRLALERR